MKREEAIDKLQWLWSEVYNEDSDASDYAEAIDMAISALQEPQIIKCKNCKFSTEDYPYHIFHGKYEQTYSCQYSTYSHNGDFYCGYAKGEEE